MAPRDYRIAAGSPRLFAVGRRGLAVGAMAFLLAGCAELTADEPPPRTTETAPAVTQGSLDMEAPSRAAETPAVGVAPRKYCYRTLARVDCYAMPLPNTHRTVVGAYDEPQS
jgi:hypothetical protein